MSAKKRQLEAKLSPKQRQAALLLVEREFTPNDQRKTLDDIATEVGLSVRGLYKWRNENADFIEYTNLIADEFLSANRAEVYGQLMKLISGSQPSVKAIDLFMRRFGLLTEKQVVETREVGNGTTPDAIAKEIEELDELLAEDTTKK
ncbi:phBC6A51 family helix-turn-helix protein [Aneurinibacillus migulanus]|uniref:phBC6A51 family helix-turn-helix protein n=1 Tax=Aneurinibacillus migulanus TaxID=47500 RepID=UPI00209F69D8|nr:phBC6A51 family helix-turn-helix protein [Aneurinibacillus migulanus]MCP1354653.1 phBC6A51 family helix-turn-helix protein [Aneurinibacillus migulanus]